ncbi:MAG: hypothetical protein R2822_25495 [Spirosomataceae bacterium]
MKSTFFSLLLAAILTGCAVSKQISEAKTLGKCQYSLVSADKATVAGIDVLQLKNLEDFDLSQSPKLALALLTKNVPLNLRIHLNITNPTKHLAGINEFDYKVLLGESEVFAGVWKERIEVQSNGNTRVPMELNTNAYHLLTDAKARDAFMGMIENLSGKANTQPAKLTIKIKPTLGKGNSSINYPGYITIERAITPEMLSGQ